MIIHLVYPVDFKKISAPWSMGNNLYKHLSKWHKVKVYQWTSYEKILPKKGDILIGHAHPNPMTCFRRSLDNVNWAKKIILQPTHQFQKFEILKTLPFVNVPSHRCLGIEGF